MIDQILLVDDDVLLTEAVRYSLEKVGYAVSVAATGADALLRARERQPDLAILDIGLPDLNGLHLCRALREADPDLPVIFLTAHDREMDVLLGFERGADDYVTKPFNLSELTARIGAILRRVRTMAPTAAAERYQIGDVTLDVVRHTVTVAGRPVDLPPKHFALLQLLISHPGEALNRQDIVDTIWGEDYFGDTRVLDVYMRGLREAVEADPSAPTHLLTVRGVGYKFREA